MNVAPLRARDARTELFVEVQAHQHPRDVSCDPGCVRVVFTEQGEFLGLVEERLISRYPHRIFADLLGRSPARVVTEDTPVDAVAALFERDHAPVAVLDARGRFSGVVTHTSLLRALLRWNEQARHRAEELLEINRHLTRRLFSAQEEERRKIARELHDEMGQYCTAIVANLQLIIDADGGADPWIQERCRTILELCDHVHGSIQAMLRRLRPDLLDEVGLRYALQDLADSWSRRHAPARCHLEWEGRDDCLGETLNIALYRIAQECLTNTARHARAGEVRIRCRRQEAYSEEREGIGPEWAFCRAVGRVQPAVACLVLEVRDDGRGFGPEAERRGLGLTGIRERVLGLDGRAVFLSQPGCGTLIRVVLPLDESRG